jgi:hypothetical protein
MVGLVKVIPGKDIIIFIILEKKTALDSLDQL